VDVFKTVGLPPYTYVKPAHYGKVRADIEQPGKHLLIEAALRRGKDLRCLKAFEVPEQAGCVMAMIGSSG
jgi:hypothetical protein